MGSKLIDILVLVFSCMSPFVKSKKKKERLCLATDQWWTSACYCFAVILAAAAGADCSEIMLSFVDNIESCQENKTGEKESVEANSFICVCWDACPSCVTKWLFNMYTDVHTGSLVNVNYVYFANPAEMLLGQASTSQRVFSREIVIGDLKRSSCPLIDSNFTEGPGRQFSSWLLSIVMLISCWGSRDGIQRQRSN